MGDSSEQAQTPAAARAGQYVEIERAPHQEGRGDRFVETR